MASPQLENGYFQIANEIAEALARTPSLGSEASQILWLVLRRSYGFQRKDAEMTISFIAKGTGLKHANVVRATERLVSKRILVHEKSLLKFNKNYDEWVVSKRIRSIQTDTPPVSKQIPKVVSKQIPNKERLKETPKKEIPTATLVAETKNLKEKKDPEEPVSLEGFLSQSRLSSRRDLHIIADWAEATSPPCVTRGQWGSYIRRHLRAAQSLSPFTEDQINTGFTKMRAAEYIEKPTLETLLKFIT